MRLGHILTVLCLLTGCEPAIYSLDPAESISVDDGDSDSRTDGDDIDTENDPSVECMLDYVDCEGSCAHITNPFRYSQCVDACFFELTNCMFTYGMQDTGDCSQKLVSCVEKCEPGSDNCRMDCEVEYYDCRG